MSTQPPPSFVYQGHKVTMLRNPGAREWLIDIEYPIGTPSITLTRPSRMSVGDVKKSVKEYLEGTQS